MSQEKSFDHLYPDILGSQNDSTPPRFDMKHILIDGELREWKGDVRRVTSQIIDRSTGDRVNTLRSAELTFEFILLGEKVFLGSFPTVGEREAMDALQAAKRAFAGGRGAWPVASADLRIKCLLKLADMVEAKTKELTKMIMWEVAKVRDEVISPAHR